MTASKTEKAFVIKRMAPSTASYLLVVNKELLLGNFAPLPLAPQIGAIIIIEYRHSGNDRNKIDICSWNPYDGYNPMAFRLAGKATDKELKERLDFMKVVSRIAKYIDMCVQLTFH
ncbi:hypothetical protein ANCCAN_21405 [Ancylostoma caninum]|uniref:Uncharacterized protein n=1 Tax=Ancylostoma caninum TaxID=29170 RepID=A0A368FKN3_ANCCA|nr:hypothetical protein ANCCAN_21405 [Ancylostoma caninum]